MAARILPRPVAVHEAAEQVPHPPARRRRRDCEPPASPGCPALSTRWASPPLAEWRVALPTFTMVKPAGCSATSAEAARTFNMLATASAKPACCARTSAGSRRPTSWPLPPARPSVSYLGWFCALAGRPDLFADPRRPRDSCRRLTPAQSNAQRDLNIGDR